MKSYFERMFELKHKILVVRRVFVRKWAEFDLFLQAHPQLFSYQLFSTLTHLNFLNFSTKVHDYKPSNVTESDFRKKIFCSNLGQKTSKNGFFGLCEKLDHLFFLISCMKVVYHRR